MLALSGSYLIGLVPLTAMLAAANSSLYQPALSTPQFNMTYQNNAQDAADIADIRQTTNLFAIAVDQHNLDLLSQVFTNDVTANFNLPSGEVLHSLSAVQQILARLQAVPSQHDQSTSYYAPKGDQKAHATTYNTGTFFGSGDLKGQVYTSYGR